MFNEIFSSSKSDIANQVSSSITSYYVIKNATTDKSREWYYVKDSKGNRVVDEAGKNIATPEMNFFYFNGYA